MRISQFKALTFDVYGTLVDWESGIVDALRPLTQKLFQALSRDEILQAHAHHESAAQRQTPGKNYAELLPIVYKRLAEDWNVSVSWAECLVYGLSVKHWPVFDDSAMALAYLRRHFKLVVLSNVDNASFAHSNEKLGMPFHIVLTAEDVGAYKPSPLNFDYMLENLARRGIEKSDILHVAESMFHDHGPANAHGVKSCWIYRRHGNAGFGATMRPEKMPHYDITFNTMAEFVDAHRRETGMQA